MIFPGTEATLLLCKLFVSGQPLIVPSGVVDNEWNVKKQASRSCSVGPVGIRYMGYQATEIQLDGRRSQLLYVFRSGNLHANTEIISANGCLPYGASCSIYWKTGGGSWLLESQSSLDNLS